MRIPKAIWILLGVVIFLNLVAIVVAIRNPDGHSYPSAQPTYTAKIDYNKINQIIAQQIAALPKAQNGSPGTPGVQGLPGVSGSKGIDGQNGLNGASGTQGQPGPVGPQGPQGDPGSPGKTIELRYNVAKAQIEWRYSGDFTWSALVSACTLTNTCP